MPARIVLIEDNPANLELMSYLLAAFGYTPLGAMDGAEGLEAAYREMPDLVICDVQLPVMDGLAVARQLRADARMRRIPIIAVTALAMVGDRDRVLAAGFDGYIAKPINPETFVRQVEAFLPPSQHSTRFSTYAASSFAPERAIARNTILVVDNLQVNLELARTILEPSGFEVFTADGMLPALAILKDRSFDLILSDVCMNEGSGYEFIQAVKADPRLCATPFVFITSTMLGDKDRAKGLALGAARFLMRPLEPHAFLAELAACLPEKGRV